MSDQGDDVEIDDEPDADAEVDAAEEIEPQRWTMDEIAEQLGPRFAERYLEPHGENALSEYGKSFESTLGLVGRGAHREPQDEEVYRSLGIEPPAPEEPAEEFVAPLYGAPWAEPESWDELVELAQSQPRRAAEFALSRDDLPNETKAWFFANWASVDAAGAFEYNQAATTKAAQEYADKVAAEIRSQVDPLVQDRLVANSESMVRQARDTIPGFNENAQTVSNLLAERQTRDPQYHAWFVNATLNEQLSEMRDLTGIAVYRNAPALDAADAEAAADKEASKTRAKTETSRSAGTGQASSPQSEFKKKNLEDFKRLKEQGVI